MLRPWLGDMLDSDSTAYLTIAERVSRGEYIESINGLWSPLNAWLIAPFIKQGHNAWEIAKWMNFIFGALNLFLFNQLLKQFKIESFIRLALMKAAAIFMAYAVYFQVFGDVLQLVFVLVYLCIIFSKQFTKKLYPSILCAVFMAIAFYAKAYSLVFFIAHFGICLFWLFKKQLISRKEAIRNYSFALITVFICILPWTIALHQKYKVWSITTLAGKLNMSWYINSGKTFKPEIKLLIPPTYSNSPSFWEDPYVSQGELSSPLSSAKHFVKWVARILHTTITAVQCFNEISFLALAVLLISLFYFFFKKDAHKDSENTNAQLLILTGMVLPLGYLMMHIETRYIWLEVFLCMILGSLLLQSLQYILGQLRYKLAVIIFAVSFIIFPILQMEALKGKNHELFEQAQNFKSYNIEGSFTSNATDAGRMWVIAYLSKNSFYTIERTDYNYQELLDEMRRYNVKYFLYESENNKVQINLGKEFKFVFKSDGFDCYELEK